MTRNTSMQGPRLRKSHDGGFAGASSLRMHCAPPASAATVAGLGTRLGCSYLRSRHGRCMLRGPKEPLETSERVITNRRNRPPSAAAVRHPHRPSPVPSACTTGRARLRFALLTLSPSEGKGREPCAGPHGAAAGPTVPTTPSRSAQIRTHSTPHLPGPPLSPPHS